MASTRSKNNEGDYDLEQKTNLGFCNYLTSQQNHYGTPTTTHFEIAQKCIKNGIHIFVEKPESGNLNLGIFPIRNLRGSGKTAIQFDPPIIQKTGIRP